MVVNKTVKSWGRKGKRKADQRLSYQDIFENDQTDIGATVPQCDGREYILQNEYGKFHHKDVKNMS